MRARPHLAAHVALAALVLGALVVAWWIRFGTDDGYISYVYARSLVYGDGLTWFGDHIEGYTNFAWVLWIAAGFAAGIDPLAWSWVGSLAALAVVLVLTYRWVQLRTASVIAALAAVAILAVNYTFLAFGTSGLETMAQCALLTACTLLVDRLRRDDALRPRTLALLSTLASLALWTRLDSAVVLAILGGVTVHRLVRARASRASWLATVLPAVVLVGGWLAWKLAYYGDILPNTFHAKVAISWPSVVAASGFVAAFFHSYMLWPLVLAAIVLAIARRSFTARLPAVLVATWLAYVVVVGGDFMEFRFFVPILPALAAVIAEVVVGDALVRAVPIVLALAGFSIHHARTFDGAGDGFYDSIGKLGTFYGHVRDNDWSKLGTPLGDVLVDTGATLACNGAGAIPYYADLPTVDQLGLNDRWVARHGAVASTFWARPGHQRFATHQYLAERKVTFVIGTPITIPRGALTRYGMTRPVLSWIEMLLGPSPIEAQSITVVAAPLNADRSLLLWYLTPTPAVDERIRRAGWEIREFHR